MLTMIGLLLVLLVVLVLPFFVKIIERQLELFLFAMGAVAVTITWQWSLPLLEEALFEPIIITVAVLAAGFAFRFLQKPIGRHINKISDRLGTRLFVFGTVVLLGLISSVITAIVASLVLVEIVNFLKLDRKTEIKLVVFACFSIGLGAALTPIGEPLATIAIGKLRGEPYHAGFWFLFDHLWYYVVSGILALGILAAVLTGKSEKNETSLTEDKEEGVKDILLRTAKIYVFVMGLVFLGTGFKPMIDQYVSKIPSYFIYWINTISAVLDNATLASAEIAPSLAINQIVSAIMGLIIAGGMLIPGNIPNIISANKLKIKSKEWARIGLPVGFGMMAVFFVILLLVNGVQ